MAGILLITHGHVGEALLKSAKSIVGKIKTPIATISISRSKKPEQLAKKAKKMVKKLDNGDGVLVLTDLYGSTPHNITKTLPKGLTYIVSGLNISMLLRSLNYADKPLEQLAEAAQQGGHVGIQCKKGNKK